MKTIRTSALALILMGHVISANADMLAEFTFQGNSVLPINVDPRINVSQMMSIGGAGDAFHPGNPDPGYGGTWWQPNATPPRYFYFNMWPQSGWQFDITDVTFDERRTGNGLTHWEVDYAIAGGGDMVMEFGALAQDQAWHTLVANNNVPSDVGMNLQVRFMALDDQTGDWMIDNVIVNGTVLPEPATWAMLAVGSAGLFALRRRK